MNKQGIFLYHVLTDINLTSAIDTKIARYVFKCIVHIEQRRTWSPVVPTY